MTPLYAEAISFYTADQTGKIIEINEKTFNDCDKIFYRTSGKDELSRAHKKRLLRALIKGETVNSLKVVIENLKTNLQSCTYGIDSEKFTSL